MHRNRVNWLKSAVPRWLTAAINVRKCKTKVSGGWMVRDCGSHRWPFLVSGVSDGVLCVPEPRCGPMTGVGGEPLPMQSSIISPAMTENDLPQPLVVRSPSVSLMKWPSSPSPTKTPTRQVSQLADQRETRLRFPALCYAIYDHVIVWCSFLLRVLVRWGAVQCKLFWLYLIKLQLIIKLIGLELFQRYVTLIIWLY